MIKFEVGKTYVSSWCSGAAIRVIKRTAETLRIECLSRWLCPFGCRDYEKSVRVSTAGFSDDIESFSVTGPDDHTKYHFLADDALD